MFTSPDEMKKYIVDEAVEQIDFKAIDLFGRWHHLTFSAKGMM